MYKHKKYKIGLHPSWQSYEQHELIKEEKKILETASKTPRSLSEIAKDIFAIEQETDGLLKEIMHKRKDDLHVVVMSATMDAEKF